MFPPNTPGAPGSTGNSPQNTNTNNSGGNNNQPEYLTKEEFSRSAAFIRGLSEKIETLTKNVPTMDLFVTLGILEKDGETYKPKSAPAAAPAKKQDQGNTDQIAEMENRFQAELKKRDDALAAERRKAAETEQRSAVIDALGKAGAVNASRDYVHVTGIGKNAAGKYVQIGKDQFGADVEFSLEDAAANFLKANPELRKAQGHPGSGTPSNAGFGGKSAGTDVNSLAEMSMEQYMAHRRKAG